MSSARCSASCNTALSLATGDLVGCLNHDDLLSKHALALAVAALRDNLTLGSSTATRTGSTATADVIRPTSNQTSIPCCSWDKNFLNRLCIFRRDLVTGVGGYREGYEGSQDSDLALRVSERLTPERVVHIPHVLYHRRGHANPTSSMLSVRPYAVDAGRHGWLRITSREPGVPAASTRIPRSGNARVMWEDLRGLLRVVNIIVPTRDGSLCSGASRVCSPLRPIRTFELVVVDNASRSLSTLDCLRAYDDQDHGDSRRT